MGQFANGAVHGSVEGINENRGFLSNKYIRNITFAEICSLHLQGVEVCQNQHGLSGLYPFSDLEK